MFGSAILETAIGLLFLYTILSVACSAVTEILSGLFGLRSRTLERGIRQLLADPRGQGLARLFYDHPIIASGGGPRPSYVPSRSFAVAVVDILSAGADMTSAESLAKVRSSIASGANESVRRWVLPLFDRANGDIERARANIASWFDDAMDRVSGWYKRSAQAILLAVACLVTAALNADTLAVAGTLFRDTALRIAVGEAAGRLAGPNAGNLPELAALLESARLPIGWVDLGSAQGDSISGWALVYKVLGLLLTALAVSKGSEFWFQILNKLVNLRSTGAPPPRAGEPGK